MKFTSAVVLCGLMGMLVTAQSSNRYADFAATFKRECKDNGVVGASFIFLKEGKLVANEHYGVSNAASNTATDENTIYHWASNTKPFTGIAIMQLRDRGLLKLDDPVTKYLPELRAVHNPYGSMDDITVRHLMTHSAGFRGSTWPWDGGKPWEPFEPTEYSQLVAMFPFTEILFKPGSKYSYSNPGIIFLGRIIEKLTGEDYEIYIDKNVFKPLEMHRSYFDTTPQHLMKHRSHSYWVSGEKRTEGRFDANTGITVSNGGLNSPLGDMVKYLNFLTGVGTGNGRERGSYDAILKRSSLEEMWQPVLDSGSGASGNPAGQTKIGLIFFIADLNGHRLIGHSGHQNGFASYIDLEPATRSASVIVFNTDLSGGNEKQKGLEGRLLAGVRSLF